MSNLLGKLLQNARKLQLNEGVIDDIKSGLDLTFGPDRRLLESDDLHFVINSKLILSESQNAVILLSGGEDSSYLLTLCVDKFGPDRVKAVAVSTKSNADDLERARAICSKLEVEFIKFYPPILELEKFATRFFSSFGRFSRDPAQPIHNLLVNRASRMYPNHVIFDGQFADTVLYSNPHNSLLLFRELFPLLSRLIGFFLKMFRVFIPASRTRQRLGTISRLLGASNIVNFIIEAAGLPRTKYVKNELSKILKDYSSQTLLTAAFYFGLTMQRERDKYKLYNENIVLPFDSPELLPLVDKNIETFVSMRLRKIPIHNFLVLRYGSIFSKQRTLPFEVR